MTTSDESLFSKPVVLIVFNRPATTRRVLDVVRAVKPRRLYVMADGPRPDHPQDQALCAETLALFSRIDWDCELVTDAAGQNLGIKRRVETGLERVFRDHDEALILEDDCLPHPTFFRYCSELLDRYRTEERVFTISGSEFTWTQRTGEPSYRFSRYPLTWGWATWRRAWQHYDPDLSDWSQRQRERWLERYLGNLRAAQYWAYIFQSELERDANWDYRWIYSSWRYDALSIHPTVNLVSNIGFGEGATHTHDPHSAMSNQPRLAMDFPLRHPESVERDAEADALIEENVFGGNLTRMLRRVRRLQLAERAGHTSREAGGNPLL